MRRLAPLLLLAAGCGSSLTSSRSPDTEIEAFAVAETARLSGLAGQRVKGEISPTLYAVRCDDGSPCHAFAWYLGAYGKGARGTAYFYERDVDRASESDVRYAAAHEVCHSLLGPGHGPSLESCAMSLYGGAAPAGFHQRFRIE